MTLARWCAVAVGAAFAVGVAGWVDHSLAQVKALAPPVVQLPLDSMYTTSEQEGVKRLTFTRGTPAEKAELTLRKQATSFGLSSVFLVRGRDIGDAVRATEKAFTLGFGAETPIDPDQGRREEGVWLVAYFGVTASSPPQWVVRGVERAGTRFRVRVGRPNRENGASADLFPYFAWVPVGPLSAGAYTLEIIDAAGGDILVGRVVRVAE